MQQVWLIDKPVTQHVSGTIVPIFSSARLYTTAVEKQPLHSAHDLPPDVPRLLPALQVLKTIHSCVQPCTREDGHSGARNMLELLVYQ